MLKLFIDERALALGTKGGSIEKKIKSTKNIIASSDWELNQRYCFKKAFLRITNLHTQTSLIILMDTVSPCVMLHLDWYQVKAFKDYAGRISQYSCYFGNGRVTFWVSTLLVLKFLQNGSCKNKNKIDQLLLLL